MSLLSCLLATAGIPLLLFGETDSLAKILSLYEGRWVGHFTIHSPATGFTETFPVEQQYWFQDGVLHGVSVSQRDGGIESARSSTRIEDGRYLSEIKRSDKTTERFVGAVHEKGIVWVPANLDRAHDYQIKESFALEEGQRLLLTEGFDTYITADGLAHLVYRGRLERRSEP